MICVVYNWMFFKRLLIDELYLFEIIEINFRIGFIKEVYI